MTQNDYFMPATEQKVLKGKWVVWMCESRDYKEAGYRIGLVGKKSGDMLITDKFARVPTFKAYVTTPEIAASWPKWDDTLGHRRITRAELDEIIPA